MNYIGSKLKLSSWILEVVKAHVGDDLSQKVFCDIFAGTGIVGRTFKKEVRQVIANDLEYYSFVLNKNYIANHKQLQDKDRYIEILNSLPLIDSGFVYQNYCRGSGSSRQYFSDTNGKKIDTIRTKIQQWKEQNTITDDIYYFLLASLLESADKVANTASVYGAYLKHIKKSALKELKLCGADFDINDNIHLVYNMDSNELIKQISGDILYLDPPYNHRQYSSNYHILNTIALYDEFIPKGKTGLPEYSRSDYCKKGEVKNSFENLIKYAKFKHIFLSYNNEGLMSGSEIKDIMIKYGKYSLETQEYQRFKADKMTNRNHKANKTYEYLHILKKEKV